MKLTGRGGQIELDGCVLSSVVSFSWQESPGEIYGETQSDISLTAILSKGSDIIRVDDVFNLILLAGNNQEVSIIAKQCRVEGCSLPFERASSLAQTVTLTSRHKAVVS